MSYQKTLSLDFDGVLHLYSSGWKGADVIPDPPVPGAIQALLGYMEHFQVAIFSSRSGQEGGLGAMRAWLVDHLTLEVEGLSVDDAKSIVADIQWPTEKPPAHVTIDDRAFQFEGVWPSVELIAEFKPWNKR